MALSSLIFDLDGTLVDSAPSILETLRVVIEEAGHEAKIPLKTSLIGPPLMSTLEVITGIADVHRLEPLAMAFKTRYDTEGLRVTQPFPGVPEFLSELSGLDVDLHIATNKRKKPTLAILEMFGWRGLFKSVYAQDSVSPGYSDKSSMLGFQLKEVAIAPALAMYIGDTPADGMAADRNGLCFTAVDWGYGDFSHVSVTSPWIHVSTPRALMHEIQRRVAA